MVTPLDSDAETILDALDPEQREVARTLVGPMRVLAGAGTGKTRAITHRIAYGVRTGTYNPSAVLAVTFTTRAAGEMRQRLRALGAVGVQARTFHSAALRQLGYFLPRTTHRLLPRLIEHKAPLVAQAAARIGLEIDRAIVRDLAAEIEWAKVSLLTAEDYQRTAAAAGRSPVGQYGPIAIARLMDTYERALAESDAMDFEDVLLATVGLLTAEPGVADEVRSRYRHFVVDEYQDVSPVQQRLLDLWLGTRQEVCVVGDPNQTIYSFAGASAQHLLDFPTRYPDAATVSLVRDYRSTPQVVALANAVIATARQERSGVELVAQRPPGPPVAYRTYADDEAEAVGVVGRIARLLAGGTKPADVAILFRTNGQSEPFEHALGQANIGFEIRGSVRFFARKEIRQAIMLLHGAAKAASPDRLERQVHDLLGTLGWAPTPPSERGEIRDRWESLDAFERLTREAIDAGVNRLVDLVAVIEERAATDHAPSAAGVMLASLHSAKGLEWDCVFLVGMSEGLMPISLAEGEAELAEERRLAYVGITRARRVLELSYAAGRAPGSAPTRRPSRFLPGPWPAVAARSV